MATAFTTRCPDVTVVVYIIFVQNTKWRETDHNIAFDFLSTYDQKERDLSKINIIIFCFKIKTYA